MKEKSLSHTSLSLFLSPLICLCPCLYLNNPGGVGVARVRGALSRPSPTCRQHPEVPEPRGCAPTTSCEARDKTQEV